VKRVLSAGVATLIGYGIANAADLPVKAPPPAAPVYMPYNWNGFYIGGNVGGAWVKGSINDDVAGLHFSTSRNRFIVSGASASPRHCAIDLR
jgi:hypothetical protein